MAKKKTDTTDTEEVSTAPEDTQDAPETTAEETAPPSDTEGVETTTEPEDPKVLPLIRTFKKEIATPLDETAILL
jgi:hypothetical protein